MRKIVLACVFSLAATSFLAPDPAEAARRRKGKPAITRVAIQDNYYYASAQGLYDKARPFFGSPVRGYEFFQQNSDRATQ